MEREADPVAAAVYDALEAHARFRPSVRVTQDRIADELGLRRETVNRACARLRDDGRVSWDQERAPGSRWRHNVYRLLCDWVRPPRRSRAYTCSEGCATESFEALRSHS